MHISRVKSERGRWATEWEIVIAINYRILLQCPVWLEFGCFYSRPTIWLIVSFSLSHSRWPNYHSFRRYCLVSSCTTYNVFYCVDSARIVRIGTQCNYYYHHAFRCRHFQRFFFFCVCVWMYTVFIPKYIFFVLEHFVKSFFYYHFY